MDLSQRELIAAAFAGDDVQADFDAAKAAEAEAEAPIVEEPAQLPGWGAWASHQRKPLWLLTAKARAAACVLRDSCILRADLHINNERCMHVYSLLLLALAGIKHGRCDPACACWQSVYAS